MPYLFTRNGNEYPSEPTGYLSTLSKVGQKADQWGGRYRVKPSRTEPWGEETGRVKMRLAVARAMRRAAWGGLVKVEMGVGRPTSAVFLIKKVMPASEPVAQPTEWADRIGIYRVEKRESPRPFGQAYLPLDANPSFVIHTTEGSTVDGAWNTLDSKSAAPHFIVGEGRIVQCRPLSAQAATVHDHNARFIQVECVGRSDIKMHRLSPQTWEPLVALTSYIHHTLGVPLRRPDGWTDQLPSGEVWAANNSRRISRKALTERGVYGHVEVPNQEPTWHWDPGSLDYAELFRRAR